MTAPDLGQLALFFPVGLRAAHVYLREQDVCVWNPAPAIWHHDLDRVNRLIAKGYEQLPEGGQDSKTGRLLTTLHGQMSEVLTLALKTASVEHRSRWVHPDDLARAEAMPVALAFYVPHSLVGDAWGRYTRWAERLPPPGYGERCGSSNIVTISPARPGPDGWGERCKDCGHIRDISAEVRAEVAEMSEAPEGE